MASIDVIMPQMGESIAEGTITKWMKKVGDKVERDEPLFEISTDKVDAEIPSPASGVLLEIRNQEGETVPVNQVVAVIGEAGEQPAAAASSREAEPPPPPPTETEAAGKDTEQMKQEETARGDAGPEGEPKVASPEPTPKPAEPAPAAEGTEEDRLKKFSSPLVRNIAAKEGVNLEDVEGTGQHGRVTKDDIMKHLEQRKAAPAAPAAVAPKPAAPAVAPAPVRLRQQA
jgi:pyruvate dehydrogenase E2 component (dihydrolipoamide acetyltransferase)